MTADTFHKQCLERHNHYRALHGCPQLLWSEDLAKKAQDWASTLAGKQYIQYSENPSIGENIAFLPVKGSYPSGEEITERWYSEESQYDYKKPGWRRGVFHFSQLVWKSSSEFGVGIAKVQGEDKYVVVAQYKPGGNGNMPGEFRKNVPQKGDVQEEIPSTDQCQEDICKPLLQERDGDVSTTEESPEVLPENVAPSLEDSENNVEPETENASSISSQEDDQDEDKPESRSSSIEDLQNEVDEVDEPHMSLRDMISSVMT